jgi:hypothetical protein
MTLRKSSNRPKERWALLAALVGTMLLVMTAATLAVHREGVFELDTPSANAQDEVKGDATLDGDDWDNICADNPADCSFQAGYPNPGVSSATSSSHEDDGNLNATIFTGGGSKDGQPISNWLWKDGAGGLPDKDNLLHAYAARYTVGDDQLIYFGSDRYANDGDATQAFWFLQSPITLNGPSEKGGTRFTGEHVDGDVLIISEFSNGGTTSTITVFKWEAGGLVALGGGTDKSCDLVPLDDPFCGMVNTNEAPTTAPWPFLDKAGSTDFRQGELYEAGINLSDPDINLDEECFSSFVAETRSSTSITATLKDFVLGDFENCEASLTTDASSNSFEIGGSVTDDATVHVQGGTNPPAPTGDVTFYVCGPSAGISSCDDSGALLSVEDLAGATVSGDDYTVTSDSFTPTSAGDYCFFATWPGDENYLNGASNEDFTDECFTVTPKTPLISTQVSDAGPVVPGTAVSDTATIGGLAAPSNGQQGTITFRAYGPDDATCATTATYTSVVDPIAGNGDYNSFTHGDGGAFAPNTPGTYRWRAFYAPDAGDVNNVAVSTPCNDADEEFVVQQFQPTLTTAQTVTIKDSATIVVAGGGPLSGMAHFQPFSDSSCMAGNELAAQQDVAVSGASGTTVSTTPITIVDPGEPTIYWKVSYTSSNAAHASIAATCTENASIVIND